MENGREEGEYLLPAHARTTGGARRRQTGPCGPDTEMFIIKDKPPVRPELLPGVLLRPLSWRSGTTCSCSITRHADGTFVPLAQKNVDTGMGLERTICILNGGKTVYETDAFAGIIAKIAELSGKHYDDDEATTRAFRIMADHLRTSTFIMGDTRGVSPSNVDQGYVLRRLIRRAVRFGMELGMQEGFTAEIGKVVIEQYAEVYPELKQNEAFVLEQFKLEETRFARTLRQGEREFEKAVSRMGESKVIDGMGPSTCTTTYGFPIEMTRELAREHGLTVDEAGFEKHFAEHQKSSHAGAEQRFKGGLADSSAQSARLHTATHLLHAALRTCAGRRGRSEGLQHHRRAPALRLLLWPQGDQGRAGAGGSAGQRVRSRRMCRL